MATLEFCQGDVTRTVRVDAIATLINSAGMWFGGVDGAITRIAGGQYHGTAFQMLRDSGLQDGQVVVAHQQAQHTGSFRDVIFVVDDMHQPLANLVLAALEAAENEGYESLAMPLMRTGVALGIVEKTPREVAIQMKEGIWTFTQRHPDSRMAIYIVVYGDPNAVKLLETV
jgi:O-acetyl-ADP-ribose deacetylase (regulator of RNase III)